MKLYHSRPFTDNIQVSPLWLLLVLLLLLPAVPLLVPTAVQAGPPGTKYGPPPDLPPPDASETDPPRRDIHMGTVDNNMHMGRDAEGNVSMQVGPPAKKNETQPPVGPFFIYPQVDVPTGATGTGATGSATQQQTGSVRRTPNVPATPVRR